MQTVSSAAPAIEQNGPQNDVTQNHFLEEGVDAKKVHAVLDYGDHQGTD
jgi:hypothetical protein